MSTLLCEGQRFVDSITADASACQQNLRGYQMITSDDWQVIEIHILTECNCRFLRSLLCFLAIYIMVWQTRLRSLGNSLQLASCCRTFVREASYRHPVKVWQRTCVFKVICRCLTSHKCARHLSGVKWKPVSGVVRASGSRGKQPANCRP